MSSMDLLLEGVVGIVFWKLSGNRWLGPLTTNAYRLNQVPVSVLRGIFRIRYGICTRRYLAGGT